MCLVVVAARTGVAGPTFRRRRPVTPQYDWETIREGTHHDTVVVPMDHGDCERRKAPEIPHRDANANARARDETGSYPRSRGMTRRPRRRSASLDARPLMTTAMTASCCMVGRVMATTDHPDAVGTRIPSSRSGRALRTGRWRRRRLLLLLVLSVCCAPWRGGGALASPTTGGVSMIATLVVVRRSATGGVDRFRRGSGTRRASALAAMETWSRSEQRRQQRHEPEPPQRDSLPMAAEEGSTHHDAITHPDATSPHGPDPMRRSESRFGVRRRVRAVLQLARSRTGVDTVHDRLDPETNASAATTSKPAPPDPAGRNETRGDPPECRVRTLVDPLALDNLDDPWEEFRVENLIVPREDQDPETCGTKFPHPNSAPPRSHVATGTRTSTASASCLSRPSSLPFELPVLSSSQLSRLDAGERVQEQSKMGREGSGFVVMDVAASSQAVWECLLDFEQYPNNIGTVRSMRLWNSHITHTRTVAKDDDAPISSTASRPFSSPVPPLRRPYGTPCVTRASFSLSKFRLNIAAIHRYTPSPPPSVGHDYMVFTLDPSCTNIVLNDAEGIWYTQPLVPPPPDDGGGAAAADDDGTSRSPMVKTRVWLLCRVKVAPVLPRFIVDYAAQRAMPRATTWLPLAVGQYQQQLRQRQQQANNEGQL